MQCGGTAPAIMQNGQDHMEESERYCRKCELAKQYGGRSGGISFAVPCTAYAGRTGRRCDVCKASGMLWEMHMVWGAYVPCLRMLCAASCCGKKDRTVPMKNGNKKERRMIHDPAIFYDEVSGNYYTYSTGAICQKSKRSGALAGNRKSCGTSAAGVGGMDRQ